jgi:hypothetical protein
LVEILGMADSLIERVLPKSIHPVSAAGFELKVGLKNGSKSPAGRRAF